MITSTSNARVKELVQLQKKSTVRNEQGVFLVEGVKMYQDIPQEQLVKVYVSETFADKQKEEINRLKDRRKLEYLSDHVFQYVSDTKDICRQTERRNQQAERQKEVRISVRSCFSICF